MIVVTGATGLLGSHLLVQLALRNEPVRALKRKHSSLDAVRYLFEHHPEAFRKIEWTDCDITDIHALAAAFRDAEKVYHCAAMISFDPKDAREMMRVNVSGTANVVNLCLEGGIKKLCHVSSVAAINRTDETGMITEETPWRKTRENSNYALSKQGAEREVWRGIAEGLNAVIINPGIIIGPGNWQSGSGRLFSRVWNGLRFYTDGISGFVSAEDVARCMVGLMEGHYSAERFIAVSENLSYRDVLFAIATALKKKRPEIRAGKFLAGVAWRGEWLKSLITGKSPFITRETALAGLKKVHFSNEKIRKATGIEFEKMDTVIRRTAQAFLNHQPTLR